MEVTVTTRRQPPPPEPLTGVAVAWLALLRWIAVGGQLAAFFVASAVLQLDLPYLWLLALVAFTALTNVWLHVSDTTSERWIFAALALDMGVLTGLLALSGATANPFTIFFILNVALGALLVPGPRAWFLVMLSCAGFGLLFFVPPSDNVVFQRSSASELHLRGAWVAYMLAAVVVTYFVSRVSGALRAREQHIATLERATANAERLASLTTLAAGAAHELGTPLGTIALVANELERALGDGELAEDTRLIRSQVERCREIIARLASSAGSLHGEPLSEVRLQDIVDRTLAGLAKSVRARVSTEVDDALVRVPPRALAQVLSDLTKNALEASTEGVNLQAWSIGDHIHFNIIDRGPGIAPVDLARLGEPFYSTKPAGVGMGLGVYLATALAKSLGGALRVQSTLGEGTKMMLVLPKEAHS